jgi:hypothetical protein
MYILTFLVPMVRKKKIIKVLPYINKFKNQFTLLRPPPTPGGHDFNRLAFYYIIKLSCKCPMVPEKKVLKIYS